MKRKRRVEGRRAAGRAGCSSVVFGSTNLSRECGGETIVVDGVVVVATAPRMAPKTSAIASRARWRRGLRWASELFSCPEWSELESQIAAVGRSAAPFTHVSKASSDCEAFAADLSTTVGCRKLVSEVVASGVQPFHFLVFTVGAW